MVHFMHYVMCLTLMISFCVGKVVDLSHKHDRTTIMSIHGAAPYNLTNLHKGVGTFGFFVELNYYGSSEHGGTHIDAPSHFTEGGKTLDQIPIEHTVLDGVMIDLSKEAAVNHKYSVSVKRLEEWESKNGKIPNEAAVLFYFGWYPKFEDEAQYRGTTEVGNSLTYVYPYLSLEAARWLLDSRGVRTLGSDTLSTDPFQIDGKASRFPIHRLYLPKDRLIVENLRDLDKLPPTGFRFHSSPVKYVGASGAQVRAYAVVHDAKDNGGDVVHKWSLLTPYLAIIIWIIW